MSRAVMFLLGIVVGVLLGAGCVLMGFQLGSVTASAAVPSRPAPISLAPLPFVPTDRFPGPRAGGYALQSHTAAPREVLMGAGQDGTDAGTRPSRPLAFGEPSMTPGRDAPPAPVEAATSARLARAGLATWYWVGDGLYGAAGPLLRTPGWRGRMVEVCAAGTSRCLELRLIDYCACGDRAGRPTLVDLSRDAFAQLVPAGPAQGVAEVTVTW